MLTIQTKRVKRPKSYSPSHNIEIVDDFDEMMGHAGAIVRHSDNLVEGAYDQRSDGAAIGE